MQVNDSAIRLARGSELTAAQLYDILTLRVEVFVIEQECPYPELDGRDLPDSTIHLWYTEGGKPLAYLRILIEPEDGTARIGRVVTAKEHRGRRLSARLMERVPLELVFAPRVLLIARLDWGATVLGDCANPAGQSCSLLCADNVASSE